MSRVAHMLLTTGQIACNGLQVLSKGEGRDETPPVVVFDAADVTCEACRVALARRAN